MLSRSESTIATDLEQATGLEKKELDAHVAGEEVNLLAEASIDAHLEFYFDIQDPFGMSVHKVVWGTKQKPTIVPSMYEERLVGCVCKCTHSHTVYEHNFGSYG